MIRSSYRGCGRCGKVPQRADFPGFGPKDNVWKNAGLIHPPVDRQRPFGIFATPGGDSCRVPVHRVHIFGPKPSPKGESGLWVPGVLHSIHSLWIISLWMRESAEYQGFWGIAATISTVCPQVCIGLHGDEYACINLHTRQNRVCGATPSMQDILHSLHFSKINDIIYPPMTQGETASARGYSVARPPASERKKQHAYCTDQ